MEADLLALHYYSSKVRIKVTVVKKISHAFNNNVIKALDKSNKVQQKLGISKNNFYFCADELTPYVSQLSTERTAKEEAVAAKNTTEKKSRDFINDQRTLIDRLNKEKVLNGELCVYVTYI